MKTLTKALLGAACCTLLLANEGGCDGTGDAAADRQTTSTKTTMDAADREVGMPRIHNFAQRKLLKNAYEDMDQTTLTYVYTQALDGKFVCLGQALGYGVALGTQFTAPYYNTDWTHGVAQMPQADPNMLYMPSSGEATIVDLINPTNGEAHTAVMEPRIVTLPFELPASAVTTPCPADVDPSKVKDVKETSAAVQLH